VGCNSLKEASELAEHAEGLGVDAISAVSPSYFRPATAAVLADCMAEIAGAAVLAGELALAAALASDTFAQAHRTYGRPVECARA